MSSSAHELIKWIIVVCGSESVQVHSARRNVIFARTLKVLGKCCLQIAFFQSRLLALNRLFVCNRVNLVGIVIVATEFNRDVVILDSVCRLPLLHSRRFKNYLEFSNLITL